MLAPHLTDSLPGPITQRRSARLCLDPSQQRLVDLDPSVSLLLTGPPSGSGWPLPGPGVP